MLTLWDLVPTNRIRAWLGGQDAARARAPGSSTPKRGAKARPTATDRYEALTRDLLAEHGVSVRRWRKAMSGIAWQVRYDNGTVKRMIESPRPKGPMSAAVFLHEIGHHAIGFNVYKPRCLEEYHAWAWAIREMERRGIDVTDGVRYRMHQSLAYAVAKARRRGLRSLPAELEPFRNPLPARIGRRRR